MLWYTLTSPEINITTSFTSLDRGGLDRVLRKVRQLVAPDSDPVNELHAAVPRAFLPQKSGCWDTYPSAPPRSAYWVCP